MTTSKLATKIAALVCALIGSGMVHAILPENGWYWNPNESGRGYQIEIQNNVLFMSTFIYDASGNPIWVVGGGPMTSDHEWSAGGIRATGGQCLGCPYVVPTVVPFGQMSLNFTSSTTATATINGTQIPLQRESFGYDFNDVATPLLGEWAFVSGNPSFPIYDGERITLGTLHDAADGRYAQGNRTGQTGANNLAIGYFDPSTKLWGILLDSSTSYYQFFVFNFAGFERLEGIEFLYQKTSTPGAGVVTIGHRIKSAVAAAGGNGPGVMKSAKALAAADAINEAKAVAVGAANSTTIATPEVQALATMLQARIERR
jgi:hypothetical protein